MGLCITKMNLYHKVVGICVIFFTFTCVIAIRSSYTNRIIFCDVGQGSATLVLLGTTQVLIDTGPDKRILNCIGKHMPFFDREIEIIIISHDQKDHNGALAMIKKKYSVERIYEEIQDTVTLKVKDALVLIHKASQSSKDINERANVVTIQLSHHTIFLPADINGIQLKSLIPRQTTIFTVPHHGSKYGLYPDSLDLAQPTLAVISVGKKNSYGHPAKEVLDILKAKNMKIWRTDQQGDLVIDLRK
jgi:competence protein ComEC